LVREVVELWEVPNHNGDVDTLHLLLGLELVVELVVLLQGICDVDIPMVVMRTLLRQPIALHRRLRCQ
jgi:hypothetical protein